MLGSDVVVVGLRLRIGCREHGCDVDVECGQIQYQDGVESTPGSCNNIQVAARAGKPGAIAIWAADAIQEISRVRDWPRQLLLAFTTTTTTTAMPDPTSQSNYEEISSDHIHFDWDINWPDHTISGSATHTLTVNQDGIHKVMCVTLQFMPRNYVDCWDFTRFDTSTLNITGVEVAGSVNEVFKIIPS